MKRYIGAIALFLVLLMILAACGGGTEVTMSNKAKKFFVRIMCGAMAAILLLGSFAILAIV